MPSLVVTEIGEAATTTSSDLTAADLIAETKRHILSGHREERNRLAGGIDSTTETLTLSFNVGGIKTGTILAIDLELFYVWESNAATKAVTVSRAELGSTAAVHASGAHVIVNPKVSDFAVFQALNHELRALSSEGLFQVKTLNITANASKVAYDMADATDVLSIIEIRAKMPGGYNEWTLIPRDLWSLSRHMDTDEFASGTMLRLEGGYPGQPYRVRYKAPFGTLVSASDNVRAVTGLHAEAMDIPPLGAAARLIAPREVKRNFTESQGEPRRAEEVPPGAVLNSTRGLLAPRMQRIEQEKTRLYQLYPVRHG